MKITDEMVDVAWKALDDALNCKLDGTEYCYGDHTPMKHALEQVFALSHAAGQDGEQCRAASGVEEIARQMEAMAEHIQASSPVQKAERLRGWVEKLRALSRGVPEGEPSRLLCWAFDNLNDMPISEEWAAEWCKQAEPLVLSGHPAIAAQRKEG